MSNQKNRQEAIRKVLNIFLMNKDKAFTKEGIVKQIMYSEGVRKVTAIEYVDLLIEMGLLDETPEGLKATN